MSLHSDEGSQFQLALRALSEEEGTYEQARALEQRLLSKLGAEALTAPLGRASAGVGKSWWMLGIGALLGMSALFGRPQHGSLMQSEHVEVPYAQPEVAARERVALPPVALAGAASLLVVTPQATTASTPSRAPQPRATRRSARRPAAPAALPSPQPLGIIGQPEAELSLLQRSRASLRRDPAAALALTEQHVREYPAGLFVEERELLAIQALLKQRRDAEAVQRAERFVAEQPASAYAVRIREMLLTSARVAATLPAPEPGGDAP